jgi:acyl-CoA reductase-like NAD-dependent aldehyde dehydrogenase
MLQIPLLRAGSPYTSLAKSSLTNVRTGEVVAEVSLANSGLIARDLGSTRENRLALEALTASELLDISSRAARLFMEEDLPLGDGSQSPDEYLQQLSATTGMPQALGRANMEKIRFVMAEMETVLGGLTRGIGTEVLDQGWTTSDDRCISFRRETDSLGVILPSNSPGVHSLWIPSIALKVPLVLKPGSREPWSPFRIAQAFLAAGCPPEAISFYPTDYAGAGEILLKCGRSMLFGDKATVSGPPSSDENSRRLWPNAWRKSRRYRSMTRAPN